MAVKQSSRIFFHYVDGTTFSSHEHHFTIEHTPSGEFIFYDQHSRKIAISPTPPIIGDDPIGNLVEMHSHIGVYINPQTGVTKWAGERMDYDMAVGGVLGPG